MAKLSQLNLGLVLKELVYHHYPTAKVCAYINNWDEHRLRNCWYERKNRKERASYRSLLSYLDKLGYEVRFTVVKKGQSNDQANLLHSNNPTEGMSIHDGSER